MKLTVKFYGVLAAAGLAIQILTSFFWFNIPNKAIGEMVFMSGQAIGEVCYFIVMRYFFKPYLVLVAVMEFAIALLLVDLVSIFFLNPYEISLSKYAGFVFAFVILLYRLTKNTK